MSASDAPSSMASASNAPSRMMLSTDDALSTVLSFCAARDLAPLRAASSRFVSLVEESVQRRLPLRCDARGCDLSMLDALEPRCWCPAATWLVSPQPVQQPQAWLRYITRQEGCLKCPSPGWDNLPPASTSSQAA